MINRKKIATAVSALALAGATTLTAPQALAQNADDPVKVQPPQDGSSGSESSEGEGSFDLGNSSEGENGSSFDDVKEQLSSDDYKEEGGTSSDAQKWALGLGIVGAILAAGGALLPQIQQFLPKI